MLINTIFLTLVLLIKSISSLAIPFIVLAINSKKINNDYKYLFDENKITTVKIEDVPLVKQDISCGYAIIEMLSTYYDVKITEEELYQKNNNSVSTSSTKGFVKEINDVIKNNNYVSKTYLKNDELLVLINKSLVKGHPVAVEWAAKYEDEWTLHWSVVTGMDENKIYINNPYGYKEEISYEEFVSRTNFTAFTNMPLFYNFGFAYGLFSKNTIIIVDNI